MSKKDVYSTPVESLLIQSLKLLLLNNEYVHSEFVLTGTGVKNLVCISPAATLVTSATTTSLSDCLITVLPDEA